jgi:hypothetical protein
VEEGFLRVGKAVGCFAAFVCVPTVYFTSDWRERVSR